MSTSTPRLGLVKPAAGEAYARSVMNNNNDIIDAYASGTADKFAKGLVNGPNNVTVNSGLITALAVVNNIPTFTFKANRRYEVTWEAHAFSSVDADYADFAIQTCLTTDSASLTTGLTMKRLITQRLFTTMNPFRVMAPVFFTVDTTVQIKFTAVRTAGTGSVTVNGTADRINVMQIFDLGQQV